MPTQGEMDEWRLMKGWRCPKCGDHYFCHRIKDCRPMCPAPDKEEARCLDVGQDQS
jgi:hypothetical protein